MKNLQNSYEGKRSKVWQPLYIKSLLLLLLLTCFTSICLAHKNSMHNYNFEHEIQQNDMPFTGVVRELPQKGESGVQAYTLATEEEDKEWKLIRIVASTKDLEDDKKYCTVVTKEVMDFEGSSSSCISSQIFTKEKKSRFIDNIIPGAIKLHRDRLRVQPHDGNLIVPDFEKESYCKYFTVPPDHRSEGVKNADFVLYVAAGPESLFGVTCAAEESSGRPIAGAMNFPPYYHTNLRLNVRLAAHEIGHALGFNLPSMTKKRVLTHPTLRGKNRKVVSSKLTKEKAQDHYGCPDLKGMELEEDESDVSGIRSHWTRRHAKDELMAPREEDGVGIYYTALTMALFEDLGYYKANWGMEEPMSWGKQKGCSFINDACLNNGIPRYPEMFCNASTTRCTSNRYTLGVCDSFDDPDSGNAIDLCPVFIGMSELHAGDEVETTSFCMFGDASPFSASLVGPDSWCLDAEGLQVKKTGGATETVNGVCARVLCDDGSRTIKVQYKGDEKKWHSCPEGTSIVVQSSVFQGGGKIKCPKYSEVCTIAPDGRSRLAIGVEPDSACTAAALPLSLSALVILAMASTLVGLP